MCKTENEILTVSQSSGLASCFPTLLYFYIKAKEEFNNFVFAPIDGAEAVLLRKGQLNPTLGYMMVSPVYITLYHRTYQNITTKRSHLYGIGYASQLSPRVTLSELTFHFFTKFSRPFTWSCELISGRRDNSKGRGRGEGMRAHAKARMFTAILSPSSAIFSNM